MIMKAKQYSTITESFELNKEEGGIPVIKICLRVTDMCHRVCFIFLTLVVHLIPSHSFIIIQLCVQFQFKCEEIYTQLD